MKLYSFKRGLLIRNLHEVVYSGQKHLRSYRFGRTEMSDSDYDDSEDSYERNSNACIAYWHNHEDKLPDSEFNARDHSDGFSFLPNALSQNGVGPHVSG